MKRNIYYLILLLTVSAMSTSCKLEEDDIFSESAAVRLNNAKAEYKSILSAASNGWKMEYFATPASEGYTFLMKFDSSELVTVAAKNQYTANTYKTENSLYDVITDNGPVLTFNSYNTLLHYFSNPENPDGAGLEGDYEFIVLKADSNLVSLKGKKRGTYIRLKKMNSDDVWSDYFSKLNDVNSTIFNSANTSLMLTINNNEAATLTNGTTHIFSCIPVVESSSDATSLPFIITDYGFRFHTALKVGDVSVQDFALNEDKTALICKDNGVNATINLPTPASLFSEILNKRKYMIFTISDDHMSTDIKSALSTITTSLTKSSRKLDYIGFTNSADWGVSLVVSSSKGTSKVEGFIGYTLSKDNNDNVTLTFNNFQTPFDKNGQNYYNNFSLSALTPLLSDQFVLTHTGIMSAVQFRFVSKTNPTKWFDLSLK